MSSYLRRLARKTARRNGAYEPKPQATRITDKGYYTLRPTKGWIFISTRRLAAQHRMAQMLGAV